MSTFFDELPGLLGLSSDNQFSAGSAASIDKASCFAGTAPASYPPDRRGVLIDAREFERRQLFRAIQRIQENRR